MGVIISTGDSDRLKSAAIASAEVSTQRCAKVAAFEKQIADLDTEIVPYRDASQLLNELRTLDRDRRAAALLGEADGDQAKRRERISELERTMPALTERAEIAKQAQATLGKKLAVARAEAEEAEKEARTLRRAAVDAHLKRRQADAIAKLQAIFDGPLAAELAKLFAIQELNFERRNLAFGFPAMMEKSVAEQIIEALNGLQAYSPYGGVPQPSPVCPSWMPKYRDTKAENLPSFEQALRAVKAEVATLLDEEDV